MGGSFVLAGREWLQCTDIAFGCVIGSNIQERVRFCQNFWEDKFGLIIRCSSLFEQNQISDTESHFYTSCWTISKYLASSNMHAH